MKTLGVVSTFVWMCSFSTLAMAIPEDNARGICPRGYSQIDETRCVKFTEIVDGDRRYALIEWDPQTGKFHLLGKYCRFAGGRIGC